MASGRYRSRFCNNFAYARIRHNVGNGFASSRGIWYTSLKRGANEIRPRRYQVIGATVHDAGGSAA